MIKISSKNLCSEKLLDVSEYVKSVENIVENFLKKAKNH